MSRVKSPPAWLVEGAMVDYHSIIGGPITQFNVRARTSPQKMDRGCWVVWLDGKSGYVSVDACTPATGSLGPSNDDSPAVQIEMRAAEIAACYVPDLADALTCGTDDEAIGWSLHRDATTPGSDVVGELHESAIDDGIPRTDEARSGWLAREIYDVVHDIEYESDDAWSWDISRPLAEQFAETAADDAEADALEPTDVIAQDPTDDTGDAQ